MICMHVCMCVCTLCMLNMHARTHACVCVTCTYIQTDKHTDIQTSRDHAYMHAHTCISVHTRIHAHDAGTEQRAGRGEDEGGLHAATRRRRQGLSRSELRLLDVLGSRVGADQGHLHAVSRHSQEHAATDRSGAAFWRQKPRRRRPRARCRPLRGGRCHVALRARWLILWYGMERYGTYSCAVPGSQHTGTVASGT